MTSGIQTLSGITLIQRRRVSLNGYWINGVTLLELMLVIGIIGILMAVAYPAYTEHYSRARRIEAKTALLDLAARQERRFSITNTYTENPSELGYGASLSEFPVDIRSGNSVYFKLQISIGTDKDTFVATAHAVAAQATDKCGDFVLDNLGAQSNISPTSVNTSECW